MAGRHYNVKFSAVIRIKKDKINDELCHAFSQEHAIFLFKRRLVQVWWSTVARRRLKQAISKIK